MKEKPFTVVFLFILAVSAVFDFLEKRYFVVVFDCFAFGWFLWLSQSNKYYNFMDKYICEIFKNKEL